MTKDKKIELQDKIIHELQEENASLTTRIKELEKIVSDNERIVKAAETYKDEHVKCIASLEEAIDEYLRETRVLAEQKRRYMKTMEVLLKTIKKNT